ncbi:phage tail tube protein [Streptomonospora litoralis]|uniref:Major tail protein n=1 Tax=Streptomonospora litoralis TaxID=2498135 RepID=A0A4P6Q3N1_9ACTN|nr:phage tail protein [Streptomonospora litoralis]QBI53424.1 hypothetical protein EKD16_08150 [Streptomonospora litoralis]
MPGVEEIATWRNELIRKALFGSVFAAAESVDLPTMTDLFNNSTGALQTLPTGFGDVGYINPDGTTMPRETEVSDVNSWQSVEPTRSDETTDTSQLSFMMQETNPTAVELFEGLELGTLPEVGEAWEWDKPPNPLGLYRRLLVIGQDTYQGQPIYVVKLYPRAKLTGREDETQNRENATERGVTMTAYRDSSINTSVRNWVDGPGWRLLASGS